MKIEGKRQERAKQLIKSLLADNGTNFNRFCKENNIDSNKQLQLLFRNKWVSLDDLNSFVSMINKQMKLELTTNSIVLTRK